MSDTFCVHLGGGAYLDSSGHITFGAPTAAQVYDTRREFKVDTKKLQDVFTRLSGMLPSSDETKSSGSARVYPNNWSSFSLLIGGSLVYNFVPIRNFSE